MAMLGLFIMCLTGWFIGFIVFGAICAAINAKLTRDTSTTLFPLYSIMYLFLTGAALYKFGG